jgi:hypothetical protein
MGLHVFSWQESDALWYELDHSEAFATLESS